MSIPLFKVFMSEKAKDTVGKTLDSGYIGQGQQVEKFEKEFSELVDAPYIPLSVNSCTSALDLALHLIGIGKGDEVITTPITCTATNGVIVQRGAIPVWADVDKTTGLINPDDVEYKITPKTKAIMAVDWGGMPCDYETLKSFGLPVIEDAAHSLLTVYKSQSIAKSGGDYVCWSLQAIKHMTTGDGGILLPPLEQLERSRLLRWYGLDRRSSQSFRCEQNIQEVGFKYHMNDINASIGLENIKYAQWVVEQHRKNADYYYWQFLDLQNIIAPPYSEDSAWWLYTMLVDEPSKFITFMKDKGIDTSPVHARNDKHDAFHYPNGPLPGVDYFSSHQISIPVGWWLTQQDKDVIVDAVYEYDRTMY